MASTLKLPLLTTFKIHLFNLGPAIIGECWNLTPPIFASHIFLGPCLFSWHHQLNPEPHHPQHDLPQHQLAPSPSFSQQVVSFCFLPFEPPVCHPAPCPPPMCTLVPLTFSFTQITTEKSLNKVTGCSLQHFRSLSCFIVFSHSTTADVLRIICKASCCSQLLGLLFRLSLRSHACRRAHCLLEL